jgi:peptidoglycan/LPS O-acetylase OafA/YrhL
MFFALSGFLVTGSAMRLALGPFALSRFLRIAPALIVDTAVSILAFGMAFTTLPKSTYFLHPQTMSYWLNCLGDIHYLLPGVFEHNPWRQINKSLWTIPSELLCYVAIGFLMATSMLKKPLVAGAGIAAIMMIDIAFHNFGGAFHFPMERELAGPTGKLVCFFLAGSITYVMRDRVPVSSILAVACVLYIAVFSVTMPESFGQHVGFAIGACIALPYLVAWLGIQPLPVPWPFKTGDYSYGVYLYAFPIQQTVVYLTGTRSPLVVMALSILPVILLATLSWHFVEKPTLKLRKFSLSSRRLGRPGRGNSAKE